MTVDDEITKTDEQRRRVCALVGLPGEFMETWRVLEMAADEIEKLQRRIRNIDYYPCITTMIRDLEAKFAATRKP